MRLTGNTHLENQCEAQEENHRENKQVAMP